MGDGIRIQPQPARWRDYGDMRDRLIIVRDISRPLSPRPEHLKPICRACGVKHDCKTYHLQLDADGTVMVSATIWGRLQRLLDCGGFEEVNVVSAPPAQSMELPTANVDLKELFGGNG